MRTRWLLPIALATVLVALPATALGDSSRAASNSATFPDSVGEDPNAPDITSVAVSNDDSGLITFQVNISNRPALTSDMFVLLFLDTDQNPSTGADRTTLVPGSEYVIELDPGVINLFEWNGSDFVSSDTQTSLVYTYQPTGPTIRISASDLGMTKALGLLVLAASGVTTDAEGNLDLSNVHVDAAPDFGHGTYAYQVLTKLILKVTAFAVAPRPAVAGKTFAASLAATENDTGGPVQDGTVTCAATIGGSRVPALSRVLTNGVASCVWKIPKTAAGKTIRGTITLTVRGVAVTRPFSAKIGQAGG